MRERAEAMLDRVGAEATPVLAADDARFVLRSLARSLAFRDERIDDDHDPRLLHPARTLRILIADEACHDAAALAAAAFVDSLDPELVPVPELDLREPAAAAAVELLRAVPHPAGDAMETLEALVIAPVPAAVTALAERLDQVRHVHLRRDQSWEHHLQEVRSAWLPAALRLAPQLARRFARWADAFERRLILRDRAGLP